SIVRDIEIAVPVAVEIARHAAEAVAVGRPGHSGGGGHVLEAAASEVAVERRARRLLGREARQAAALDEVDVLAAVAVVVEDADAGAERLEHVLASGGAVDVPEGDARGRRDVLEARDRRDSAGACGP